MGIMAQNMPQIQMTYCHPLGATNSNQEQTVMDLKNYKTINHL